MSGPSGRQPADRRGCRAFVVVGSAGRGRRLGSFACGVLVADLRKYQVSITGTRAAPCAGPARISGATYLDIEKET
jgi:hypothetical protein